MGCIDGLDEVVGIELVDGLVLGWDEGIEDGWTDRLGNSLGIDVGQPDTEGCSEGCGRQRLPG